MLTILIGHYQKYSLNHKKIYLQSSIGIHIFWGLTPGDAWEIKTRPTFTQPFEL